jgi:hypothetical protein
MCWRRLPRNGGCRECGEGRGLGGMRGRGDVPGVACLPTSLAVAQHRADPAMARGLECSPLSPLTGPTGPTKWASRRVPEDTSPGLDALPASRFSGLCPQGPSWTAAAPMTSCLAPSDRMGGGRRGPRRAPSGTAVALETAGIRGGADGAALSLPHSATSSPRPRTSLRTQLTPPRASVAALAHNVP